MNAMQGEEEESSSLSDVISIVWTSLEVGGLLDCIVWSFSLALKKSSQLSTERKHLTYSHPYYECIMNLTHENLPM